MGRVFHHEIRRGDSDWHREEAGGFGGSPSGDLLVVVVVWLVFMLGRGKPDPIFTVFFC